MYKKLFNKSNRKKTIRYGLLIANLILVSIVTVFVLQKPSTSGITVSNAVLMTKEESSADPLDSLSSADIALSVASMSDLPEKTSVANLADTVNAQLTVAPADDVVVAQPQIIASGLKSRADIITYTTVEGDTVESIAKKFGITSDTIKWSNNITGNQVDVGTQLIISPVSGLIYTVTANDTIDNLVARFRVNKDQFIAFNDLETGQLPVGQKIVLPNGQPPIPTGNRAAYRSSAGFVASYGSSNGYDVGYCTWWAANRRAAIGNPIPSNLGNASTWLSRAAAAGLGTGRSPRAGAVIWTPPRDFYGHVGFVESVNPDASVNISEMNVNGWNRVSRSTISAAEAARYSYIY